MADLGDPVYAAWYEGMAGEALLGLGRWTDGIAAIDAALRAPLDGETRGALIRSRSLAQARLGPVDAPPVAVAAARGFAAIARFDRAAIRAAADEVRAASAGASVEEARIGERLAAELDDAAAAWRVEADGARFEAPDGRWIEVGNHPANRRILAALARARVDEPDRALTVDDLAAAGWPGERILRDAAANRVRVALSQLRRGGLAPLTRTRDGWRLDPAVPLRLVTGGGR
jgi:hypothetical protein